MRHALAAAVLLTACAAPKPQAAPTTGPPATKPAAMGSERWDFSPAGPTTTLAPVVPATVAPPVTTALPDVVPLEASEPVRAVGECGGWEDVVAAHFPASEVGNACSVLLCESQGNPNAVSRTNDHGLLQLHAGSAGFPGGWQAEFERVTGAPFFNGVYDPNLNVMFGAWLHARSGWSPWACAP